MNWLGQQLEIKQMEDWYQVSMRRIEQVAPYNPFRKYSLGTLLTKMYPQHSWDLSKLEK